MTNEHLRVESMHKGKTVKTVVVTGIMGDTTEEILAVALKFAGETDTSHWGATVEREPHGDYTRAIVKIYTD